jgi:hypothetical protein
VSVESPVATLFQFASRAASCSAGDCGRGSGRATIAPTCDSDDSSVAHFPFAAFAAFIATFQHAMHLPLAPFWGATCPRASFG